MGRRNPLALPSPLYRGRGRIEEVGEVALRGTALPRNGGEETQPSLWVPFAGCLEFPFSLV